MPVTGAVDVAVKFHPLSKSNGGFIRFSFVLATVSKTFGYQDLLYKRYMFPFVSFKVKDI